MSNTALNQRRGLSKPEIGSQTDPLEGQWFPDGFIGTMGELLCAIEEQREPSISRCDNFNTLALVFAAYRSA